MSVLKRRSRIVSFRLSQAEYEALRDTCIAQGARSIADFTRAAACGLARTGNGSTDDLFEATVRTLLGRVEGLGREIRRLAHLLEPLHPPALKKHSRATKST